MNALRALKARRGIAIPRAQRSDSYPLSCGQQAIWTASRVPGGNVAYNLGGAFALEGELDADALERALAAVCRRHDSLRTSFALSGVQPRQHVAADIDFRLVQIDLSASPDSIKAAIEDEQRAPFDLSIAPLLRATLLRQSATRSVLVLTMHHIIGDGWSISVLVREVSEIYASIRLGTLLALPDLKIQFPDFAVWQRAQIDNGAWESSRQYWLTKLGGEIPLLALPLDFPRPVICQHRGRARDFDLGAAGLARAQKLAANCNATPFIVLAALIKALLYRLTGQDDLTVGIPAAGRDNPQLAGQIGYYASVVAVRVNGLSDHLPFSDFLTRVRQSIVEGLEHQRYPIEQIIVDRKKQGLSGELFNVMIAVSEAWAQPQAPGVKVEPMITSESTSKFDLQFSISTHSDTLGVSITYDAALFAEDSIRRLGERLSALLESVSINPASALGSVRILPSSERALLLSWNLPQEAFPAGSLDELLAQQALSTPDRVAVQFRGRSLSYRHLDEQANHLARVLRAHPKFKRGSVVAITAQRSLEYLVGLLAIVKAGAAYLPLDPTLPAERAAFMIQDSGACLVLAQSGHDALRATVPVLNLGLTEVLETAGGVPQRWHTADDRLYVIYTSGTTGLPKGSEITHRGFVNLLAWFNRQFQFHEDNRVLQATSLAFDLSQKNLFAPLLTGGTVVFYDDLEFDASSLVAQIAAARATWINTTPSMFYATLLIARARYFEDLASLRYVFLGGEPVSKQRLSEWLQSSSCQSVVVNTYGPTECTDVTVFHRMTDRDGDDVPLGNAVANTTLFVVDRALNLQPIGVPGQLAIGGASLGIGYLNRPDLTASRFVPNPFGAPGQRLYLTGDIVRWRYDGTLQYVGRCDDQVKIRGFRVETGEVEAALLDAPGVRQAAVLARPFGDQLSLCAYLSGNITLDLGAVRSHLRSRLPAYMAPSRFIVLPELPLNSNGKIDRKSLPAPSLSDQTVVESPPVDSIEATLVEVFKQVSDSDFSSTSRGFLDYNGDSLTAVQAQILLEQKRIRLDIRDLLSNRTIRDLARELRKSIAKRPPSDELTFESLMPTSADRYYATTSPQKRVYTLQRFAPTDVAYNLPSAFLLDKSVSADQLQAAIDTVVSRHECLRTSFTVHQWKLVQEVHAAARCVIEREQGAESLESCFKSFCRPFDLSKAPLVRVKLVQLPGADALLLIDLHHIICDGVSLALLLRDLGQALQGRSLSPQRLTFKDYCQWLDRDDVRSSIRGQRDYWLNVFDGTIPTLNLPLDFPRPEIKDTVGDCVRFHLSEDVANHLRAFCRASKITTYMALLAGFSILLAEASGQEDIVIGSPVAGRGHPDLEDIVGMFVNTVAIRLSPAKGKPFPAFIKEVRQSVLGALQRQLYPFEELVENLNLKKDPSRNPLYEATLALQNFSGADVLDHAQPIIRPFPLERTQAKFDLALVAFDQRGQLGFALQYATSLFRVDTIQNLASRFTAILDRMGENPDCAISELCSSAVSRPASPTQQLVS